MSYEYNKNLNTYSMNTSLGWKGINYYNTMYTARYSTDPSLDVKDHNIAMECYLRNTPKTQAYKCKFTSGKTKTFVGMKYYDIGDTVLVQGNDVTVAEIIEPVTLDLACTEKYLFILGSVIVPDSADEYIDTIKEEIKEMKIKSQNDAIIKEAGYEV